MKKTKKTTKLIFNEITDQEIIQLINKDYPINIKFMERIIDRIYAKYPLIDKIEISIIVRAVFESIREFLILGYIINFNRFVFDMKLHVFEYAAKTKKYLGLKVKATTPPSIRKIND
jgi:hypothetical protein